MPLLKHHRSETVRPARRWRAGRAVIAAVAAAVTGACSPDRPLQPAAAQLSWLAEFTRPAGARYPLLADSAKFGELSGLARDTESGQWVAVIDDRETRVAWLTIEYADGRLSVSPSRLMPLRAGPGVPSRVVTEADLEAIVALPDGTFLLGEEGHIANGETWQPAMLHTTRDGVVTDVVAYPDAYQIHRDQTRGLRPNQGFESLTRLPNGHVIAGLEQPLFEDDGLTTFGRGARGRLIEFAPKNGRWEVGGQWTYRIGPIPRVEGFMSVCDGGANGLVELLALTDTTLLSMERACLQNPETKEAANAIQIFSVTLDRSEARKTLVLDVGTLTPRLSKDLQHLDNFEGMAFGPPEAGGRASVLIVSDDNFRKTQKTSFLLFGLH